MFEAFSVVPCEYFGREFSDGWCPEEFDRWVEEAFRFAIESCFCDLEFGRNAVWKCEGSYGVLLAHSGHVDVEGLSEVFVGDLLCTSVAAVVDEHCLGFVIIANDSSGI